MPDTPSDFVLIPVHNRRSVTLAALEALAADGVFGWTCVVVIDDGSSDGTDRAIAADFPAVSLLRGDGTWWWCGAIRRGMQHALARGAERVFWLNDDCRVPPGGLARLREFAAREGCVAWIDARAPGGWSYGAHRKTAWCVRRCTPAEERAGRIDTFSGNCVCLPREWINRAGLPDDQLFPHGIGDLDYGLRLHAAGAPLRPLPAVTATSLDPSRESSESWLTSERPMLAIWRDFHSPRSFLFFPAWRAFALRHWGAAWGWVVFGAPYLRWAAIGVIRAITPRPLLRRFARQGAASRRLVPPRP